MTSFDKRMQEKSCNCRNSKCMKLYCECFSARVECNKSCRCLDCHNQSNGDAIKLYKDLGSGLDKNRGSQGVRTGKGCACRKSGCTKKYCECFQLGVSCTEMCKCVECQNNESLTNRKILQELKRYGESSVKPAKLYPIILSQNSEQANNIISESNPLNLDEEFMDKSAEMLFIKANNGGEIAILESFMNILADLEKKAKDDQEMRDDNMEGSL